MKVLFLDDDPERRKYFLSRFPFAKTVETAQECIDELYNEDWDEMWLDHDLSNEIFTDSNREDTGMEVVRHIEKLAAETGPIIPIPNINRIVVHSLNTYAAMSMIERLRKIGYTVDRIPFTLLWNL